MVLRGVCMMRPSEIEWMFGGGAGHLQPRVSMHNQSKHSSSCTLCCHQNQSASAPHPADSSSTCDCALQMQLL